jgi:hypothetical protein
MHTNFVLCHAKTASEDRALIKMYGPKREEVPAERKRHTVYSSLHIMMIKSMKGVRNFWGAGDVYTYVRVLGANHERKEVVRDVRGQISRKQNILMDSDTLDVATKQHTFYLIW